MRRPDSLVAQISGDMDPPWTCVCVVCMCGEGGWGPPVRPASAPRVFSPLRRRQATEVTSFVQLKI